jgi:hypothetical protein
MKLSRNAVLFLAGMALIGVSLACAGGAAAPQPTMSVGPEGSTQPAPDVRPAIPEQRRITLEFPPAIRVGDSDRVRLTLEVDKFGNLTPTAEVSGNQVTGKTVEVPNLYKTHNVTAEARLDMAGVEVRPQEIISAPMKQGEPVTFYWSVRPREAGTYRGTVWLFLKFVNKTTGEQSQRALSAQEIQIRSTDLFGFSANLARTTGSVGTIVGGIVGFPFIRDILIFLFRRRKKAQQ